jgi:ribosomal protein S18 acetylase RimI-like enzyme
MLMRKRRPTTDDRRIYHLIKTELLPLTRESFPSKKFTKSEMYRRLRRGSTYVVARKKFKPSGVIHWYTINNTLWVDMLALNKQQRGKGWGKRLLNKAESAGKKENCDIAYLYVDQLNTKAQQFYRHQGYSNVHFDVNLKCYLYSKPLDE